MSSLFQQQQIVKGLLVLCVFQIFSIEARFKNLSKTNFFENVRLRPQPSTSIAIEPRRRIPSHSSSTSSLNSMKTVDLKKTSHPSSESSLDNYRSASSPALNTANSPAIMQETSLSLHRQAASTLNVASRPNRRHRLIPNFERILSMGKYTKNVAIGAAGIGGTLLIADHFSNSEQNKEQSNDEGINTTNAAATTQPPEISNPIGVDK